MLIKIDDRVSAKLAEDREGLVKEMARSTKMYSWVKGEDVGRQLDRFASANKRALFADLINWSKETYMDRLDAQIHGKDFDLYKLALPEAPVIPYPAPERTTFISDAISARPRTQPVGANNIQSIQPATPRMDLKKVAEPGNEPAEDDGGEETGTILSKEQVADLLSQDHGTAEGAPVSNPFAKK